MQILMAIGTRPDYIKSWSVYQAFVQQGIFPTIVATGQHHAILCQQQAILPMPIDHWLLDHQPSVPLGQLYGLIYSAALEYLSGKRPHAVFVSGDTTSSLAVAQAAFHLQIPVAHIEAGLRTGCLDSPYPEEFNRIAIDLLSTWLFAPTSRAARACTKINRQGMIFTTGNTVLDALQYVLPQVPVESHPAPYVLVDLHRRETDTAKLQAIIEAIITQARKFHVDVIWPAHPRPAVQAVVQACAHYGPQITILPPQPYLSFINWMRGAQLILTDSGGVVEEAITLGTPTLQLRDHTDREEAAEHQYSWLATTDPDKISRLLEIALPYASCWKERMRNAKNPYGDGHAGEDIVQCFLEHCTI
jgi:UDP-N-acetylglucosamine 2-epimerase (non-hydrolysing)